jgi:hypothetical protein
MLDLFDLLCYKRMYNSCLKVSLNISDLYYLDLLFDLSQSLSLSIFREKDYISLMSTADWVNLALHCFILYCRSNVNNIGLMDDDMSLAPSRSAIVYDLTSVFLSFFLVDCKIKSTGTPLNPRTKFRTCTRVKQISQARVCFSYQQPAFWRWSDLPTYGGQTGPPGGKLAELSNIW